MDLQVQKVLLRVLSKEELGRMFPIAPEKKRNYFCMCIIPGAGEWVCTRPKNHDGPHVRHVIETFDGGGLFPLGWLNTGKELTVRFAEPKP